MIVFERVSFLQKIHSFSNKWVFVTMFLLLFAVSALIHPVYAVDADCEPNLIEGLRTKCLPFADPATGQILPGTEYYKCADNIQCDLDVNNHNTRRCCVEPTPGSYGGDCKDPGAISRVDLGTDSGGPDNIMDFKPKNCNVDEDAVSPAGERVFVVPPLPPILPGDPPREQSLFEFIATNNRIPTDEPTGSVNGLPIIEETLQVDIRPLLQVPAKRSTTWFFTVDDSNTPPQVYGTRRYYINESIAQNVGLLNYYIDGVSLGLRKPTDPRKSTGAGSGPLKNLGCKIGNAFLTPLYNGIAALNRMVTNQNNLPDVTLLCNYGTPQFLDPAALTFEPTGAITGLDPTKCKCVDVNSGPGTAAVLLCTRFIAGIEDGNTGGAQWRALLPQPDPATNIGRFSGLLFGALIETDTIDQFRQGVKSEMDGFFNSNEVRQWADYLVVLSSNVYIPEIFLERFFGVRSMDVNAPPLTNAELETFKKNPFVRQYIGCLSCALYGGYPSALGCMPMDKVERFLAEGVLGIGITFAGAFSVLCIIFGAIQFQLSGGESAKVQKAQKLITQCVVGLLIIIFSIFLLRFVGINLLRIYGLG
jgi:hypothetical protein